MANSSTVSAGDQATAAQYNNLRKDIVVGSLQHLTSVSGTDTIAASADAQYVAYEAGNAFSFIPANTNTGAATLNINTLGAKNLYKMSTAGLVALIAGDLIQNDVVRVVYDGTQFVVSNEMIKSDEAAVLTGGSSSNAASLHTHLNLSKRLATFTTNVTVTASTTETTITSVSLGANLLGTANTVRFSVNITDFDSQAGAETLTIRLKYGATTVATVQLDPNGARTNFNGFIDAKLFGAGATNAQEGGIFLFVGVSGAAINTGDPIVNLMGFGTAAEDSTGALTVSLTSQWGSNNASNSVTYGHGMIELIAG